MKLTKMRCWRFNRALLPAPISVLSQFGINPGKVNYRGYWQFCCPFHKEGKESHPSFNLHHISGHYRCHACGMKGSDIIAFYMHKTGASFIRACIALGAWENHYE